MSTVSAAPATLPAPRPVTPLGILAASLADLVRRASDVPGLNARFVADLTAASALAGGLDPYVTACTTQESPALAELARRTQAEDWAGRSDGVFLEQEMLSGHVEGQLLKMFVYATRARRVLEIGMFTGYSALAMAEALADEGRVLALELDVEVAAFARRCFDESPVGDRIDVLVGPAEASLAGLIATGETFDLVFIDADKGGYAGYLDQLLSSGLLAPDALILVDNTLMQGLPYGAGTQTDNGRAVAEFNRTVADDPRVEQVLVPLRDGITVIRQTGTTGSTTTGDQS